MTRIAIPPFSSAADRNYEVTPLEFFFDLVFVFALLQLARHLLSHLSWRGLAETAVMLLAVFAVWLYPSWAATVIRAERARVRWMVLAVMWLGLFMNAAITSAFGASGWIFAVPLLLSVLGCAVWSFWNAPDALYRRQYSHVIFWLVLTAPLWILGAATSAHARLGWWAAAAGIDLAGRWLGHPVPGQRLHSENVPFEGGHMLERCRLFLLIALGETVLAAGFAIAAAPATLMTVVTGTSAFVGTTALWWLGFGRAGQIVTRHVTGTRDPVRASLHAANALTVMVAGLIAVAVANEEVIARPHAEPSAIVSTLMYGGPILFLLAQGGYLWSQPGASPHRHLIGSAVLLLLGFAALAMPPYASLVMASAMLVALIAFSRL